MVVTFGICPIPTFSFVSDGPHHRIVHTSHTVEKCDSSKRLLNQHFQCPDKQKVMRTPTPPMIPPMKNSFPHCRI